MISADAPLQQSARGSRPRRALLLLCLVGCFVTGCRSADELKVPPGFDPQQVAEFGRIFHGLPVRPQSGALRDFGRSRKGTTHYFEALPSSTEEARAIMQRAIEAKVAVRFRGRGHSSHGESLPHARELLVKSDNLRGYSFDEPGTITVDAGVSMYGLHLFLQGRDMILPVFNDGGFGPSVGGYISAGGFGVNSAEYGGFWENVESVDLVDGRGQHIVIFRDHADFPWLFGSMGQFGLILRAKLKVVRESAETVYPQGEVGRLPMVGQEQWDREMKNPVYWLTVFTPKEDKEEVQAELARLLRGAEIFDYNSQVSMIDNLGTYTYLLKFRTFTPPLINQHAGDLIAHGAWAFLKKTATEADFFAFQKSFHEMVVSHPGWSRYVQSEALPPSFDFARYWGESVYGRFRNLKESYDPFGLINGTWVFPSTAAPADR